MRALLRMPPDGSGSVICVDWVLCKSLSMSVTKCLVHQSLDEL